MTGWAIENAEFNLLDLLWTHGWAWERQNKRLHKWNWKNVLASIDFWVEAGEELYE